MKLLSRDFTLGEKILILLLVIFLLGLAYYQFVDVPVRTSLAKAASEKSALEVELEAVNVKVAQLTRMQNELDELESTGAISSMPSYSNINRVNRLINDTLEGLNWRVDWSNVTRSGNQVRRNISFNFYAADYDEMERVISAFATSEYRCLIGDVRASFTRYDRLSDRYRDEVSVTMTVTFYETMVGGAVDAGLPADTSEAK